MLKDHADLTAQGARGLQAATIALHFLTEQGDGAVLALVDGLQSRNHSDERGFPRAGCTDQGNHLSRLNLERDVFQY